VIKHIDTQEKDAVLTEDQAKASKESIQKITKQHEDQIDALTSGKAKEIEEG
jgi:ribosome recycling factor